MNEWIRTAAIFCLTGCLFSCSVKNTAEKSNSTGLIIENAESFPRMDEQLVVKRSQLVKLEEKWQEGFFPVVRDGDKMIPNQVDDLDGDGVWDELALVLDVSGKSKKELLIEAKKKENLPAFPKRAHAFLHKSPDRNGKFQPVMEERLPDHHFPQEKPPLYQMEGPVWENDQGAFRLYFDSRNGKDIFGKSTSRIMMDSIGLPGEDYHSQQPWGMDVLKVGSSLGAGALAFLIKEENGEEKMYRLGSEVGEMRYKLISDGPVRAIIRMSYSDVQMGGLTFDVEEDIFIWAGSPAYQSRVKLSGLSQPLQLVTGIVNLHAVTLPVEKIEEQYAMLATHDPQSENKDYLGMALLAPKEQFIRFDKAPQDGAEITDTYTMVFDVAPEKTITYEFLAAWEGRDKAYANADQFLKTVESYAQKQFNPVNFWVR